MLQGEDNNRRNPEVSVFVNDFLEYKLRQSGFQWTPPRATENIERTIAAKAGLALRILSDEFSLQYREDITELCERLELDEALDVRSTIFGIANELFSEGIKWARIVAFFVFSSELAIYCKDRHFPNLINHIAVGLSSYVSEKLLPWINDHGGWEELIIFNESRDPDHPNEPNGDSTWPTVKNLLCIGISALGALSLGALLTKS